MAARSNDLGVSTGLVLVILSLTGLMVSFSESMLIPALPTLQAEFHTTEAVVSFSSLPLKLATRIGLVISLAGFFYLLWILLGYFLVGHLVSGWGSLICVVLILGGWQLTFIGLIGQYLARIFEEVKGRPLYILKQHPEGSKSGQTGALKAD
jgi:MFS family permease